MCPLALIALEVDWLLRRTIALYLATFRLAVPTNITGKRH